MSEALEINDVDWKEVTADVRKASLAFHRSTGFDVSSCESAAWYGVARAFRLFEKGHEGGATFRTYYTRAIYTRMIYDRSLLAQAVCVPQSRYSELNFHTEDIAPLANILPDNDKCDEGDCLHIPANCPPVDKLLSSLKPKDAQIVRDYFLNNVPQKDIAAKYRVTRTAISLRVARALAKMRGRAQEAEALNELLNN